MRTKFSNTWFEKQSWRHLGSYFLRCPVSIHLINLLWSKMATKVIWILRHQSLFMFINHDLSTNATLRWFSLLVVHWFCRTGICIFVVTKLILIIVASILIMRWSKKSILSSVIVYSTMIDELHDPVWSLMIIGFAKFHVQHHHWSILTVGILIISLRQW